MEQWTMDIWAAIGAAFIIGAIIGCTLVRALHSGVRKQHELEAELKQTQALFDEQKQTLEQHFEQSAQLLSTLATDYKKLYTHLAQSSEQLLPEVAKNITFFQQSQLPVQAEMSEQTEEKGENEPLPEQQKNIIKENPPKDYSEGSSGLLKP